MTTNRAHIEQAAENVRFHYRAALEHVQQLGDVLLEVRDLGYAGDMPSATFTHALFDTSGSFARRDADILADQTERFVQLLLETTAVDASYGTALARALGEDTACEQCSNEVPADNRVRVTDGWCCAACLTRQPAALNLGCASCYAERPDPTGFSACAEPCWKGSDLEDETIRPDRSKAVA